MPQKSWTSIFEPIDPPGVLKAFILIFVLGAFLFSVYILVRPDHSQKISLSPFPVTAPFVPPDSSACGRDIIKCSSQSDCDQKCVFEGGGKSSDYSCTALNGKNAYYNGTKLDPKGSYCLPKQSVNKLVGCGTYTGRSLWTAAEDGTQQWDCQCIYPSLFSGDDCLEQRACYLASQNKHAELVYSDPEGKMDPSRVWGPGKFGPQTPPSDTPFDMHSNGQPKYVCDCASIGGIRYQGDPYRCHDDPCYAGGGAAGAAKFDPATSQCQCLDGKALTKSNVSGFCYPYDNLDICKPDPVSQTCTCGNLFIDSKGVGLIFSWKGSYYLTAQHKTNCSDPRSTTAVKILIDDPSDLAQLEQAANGNNDFANIEGGKIEYQLSTYPTIKAGDLCQDENYRNLFSAAMTAQNYKKAVFNSIVRNGGGYTVNPCDSFYYSMPGKPPCSTLPGSSDLNKTGNTCLNYCSQIQDVCGGPSAGTCDNDAFSPNGYNCMCQQGFKLNKDATKCVPCAVKGVDCGSGQICCSGECKEKIDTICNDKTCVDKHTGKYYCE